MTNVVSMQAYKDAHKSAKTRKLEGILAEIADDNELKELAARQKRNKRIVKEYKLKKERK